MEGSNPDEKIAEIIREIPVSQYLVAHSKPNGNGWKGFFHSNLFTALIVFILSQGVVIAGLWISYTYKITSLTEWKASMELKLEAIYSEIRNNEKGMDYSKNKIEEQERDVGRLESRVKTVEDNTKHFDVMEYENRRLTEDVEKLKNGKK